MAKPIYLDARTRKRLDLLRRSGKKAARAAEKMTEIIFRLRSGTAVPNQAGTMTRHGEMRIRGVVKFDLGSGYRLIAFRHGSGLFLLYVGTHDDCHRWIENNREFSIDNVRRRCARLAARTGGSDPESNPKPESEAGVKSISENTGTHGEPEEEFGDPLAEIADQDLRWIFRGLTKKPS